MKKIVVVLLVLVVLAVAGAVAFPFALSLAKVVRSRQHMDSALAVKAQGDDRAAYSKMQSAYNLNPDYGPIIKLLGIYAADVRHPQALDWWTRAAALELLSFQESLDMIRFGIESGQFDKVKPFLARMLTRHPDSPEVKVLQVQALRRERLDFAAYTLARTLVEEGREEPEVVSAYIYYSFSLPQSSAEDQEKAFANLKRFSRLEGDTGLLALRTILRFWPRLTPEEKDAFESLLVAHPGSELQDWLSVLSLRRAQDLDNPQEILSKAEAYYAKAPTPDNQTTFVNWLNLHGYSERALAAFDEQAPPTDPGLYFAWQMALIGGGQAQKAYDLSLGSTPLTPARSVVLRAQALEQLGRDSEVSATLGTAVEVAQTEEVLWLEAVLRQLNQPDLVIALYQKLQGTLKDPLPANLKLMAAYYASRREQDLSRLLRQIPSARLDPFPRDKIDYLYLKLLFGQDLAATRREAESFATQFPAIIDFRIILAFSYTLSGNSEAAVALVEAMKEMDFASRPKLLVMVAAVLARGGQEENARKLLAAVPPDSLLAQEKVFLSGLI